MKICKRPGHPEVRRNSFKSVYINVPEPPKNLPGLGIPPYFLSSRTTARALGVSNDTLVKWRRTYRRPNVEHLGPSPVRMKSGKMHVYRYRTEDVLGLPEGWWITEFRRERAAWIERQNRKARSAAA